MYDIVFAQGVADDLRRVPPSRRGQLLDRIEAQLRYEPAQESRNRKILVGLVPPWQQVEPVWQLRVGEYRVFYDVDERASRVIIRAIRHKPPHKTTEEIL